MPGAEHASSLRTEHAHGPYTRKLSPFREGLQDQRLTNKSQSRSMLEREAPGGMGERYKAQAEKAEKAPQGGGRPRPRPRPTRGRAGQGRDDMRLGEGNSGCHILTSTRCALSRQDLHRACAYSAGRIYTAHARTQLAGPTQPFIELLHLAWQPQLREVPSVDQHVAIGHLDWVCP